MYKSKRHNPFGSFRSDRRRHITQAVIVAAVALAVVLMICAVCLRPVGLLLFIGGSPVGRVESRAVVDGAIKTVRAEYYVETGEACPLPEVRCELTPLAATAPCLSGNDCALLLRAESGAAVESDRVDAFWLCIDGQPFAPAAQERDILTVLARINSELSEMAAEHEEVNSISLRCDISIIADRADADDIKDADGLYELLLRPSASAARPFSLTSDGMSGEADAESSPASLYLSAEYAESALLRFGITKVETGVVTSPYVTVIVSDGERPAGYTRVLEKGSCGSDRVTSLVTLDAVSGLVLERVTVSSECIAEPVNAVVCVGTRDPSSPGVSTGSYVWPVDRTGKNVLITSYFSEYRKDFDTSSGHHGVDLTAAYGENIYASDGGVVTYLGPLGDYGNLIVITHADAYKTYYAHLSGYAVSYGDEVAQGQLIGYAGDTGLVTAAHLHFEVRHGSVPVDPLSCLN